MKVVIACGVYMRTYLPRPQDVHKRCLPGRLYGGYYKAAITRYSQVHADLQPYNCNLSRLREEQPAVGSMLPSAAGELSHMHTR